MRGSTAMPRIVLLLLTAYVLTAAAVENEKVFTAEDFEHDRVPRCSPLNEPGSILVQISPKLSPYRFTLIPEPVVKTDGGIRHAGQIEISRAATGATLQTIDVISNWHDSVCRLFDAKDVNFDGYLDISVVREGAGTWASRDYYVFDPKTGRFISTDLTHDLGQLKDNGLIFDWKTHEIQAAFMFSLCGGVDIYRIENGRLVKIQEGEVTVDPEGHRCVQTVRRRVHGRWKVVRVETTKLPRDG